MHTLDANHAGFRFKGYKGQRIPVRTPYFTWHGRPNTLLSYLLRDTIVGLESAVSSGVWSMAAKQGRLTDDVREATQNPFSIVGLSGTAACAPLARQLKCLSYTFVSTHEPRDAICCLIWTAHPDSSGTHRQYGGT